jgi:hypothetical protein
MNRYGVYSRGTPSPMTPGALAILPFAFRILSLLPDLTIRKKCCRVQGRDGSLMLAPYFRCSLIGDCFKFPCKFPGRLVPSLSANLFRGKGGCLVCCSYQITSYWLIETRQSVCVLTCLHSRVSEWKNVRVFACTSVRVE